MALGDVTESVPDLVEIEALASATATNSPPAGASAGLAVDAIKSALKGYVPGTMSLLIYSTAGSGTMTVTCRLWGYVPGAAVWVPLGPGGDATKGVINEGQAIGETGTDTIRHMEPVDLPGHVARLYVEVTAIGGTATAVTGKLVARRQSGGV